MCFNIQLIHQFNSRTSLEYKRARFTIEDIFPGFINVCGYIKLKVHIWISERIHTSLR